jgi:hypothetical protein
MEDNETIVKVGALLRELDESDDSSLVETTLGKLIEIDISSHEADVCYSII